MVQGSTIKAICNSVKRLMRGLGLIVASPLLLLCALSAAVVGGPLLCWRCCFVRRWKAIFSRYDETAVVIGNVIDSKVVGGNEGFSLYGVTYSYKCKDTGNAGTCCECSSQSFQRTRHYVKIPRSVDDFGPPPHRPADLEPGKPIRLVMIPGHPESALPLETLKKIKMQSLITDSVYACIISPDKSRKDTCVDGLLQFFCFMWWFPFTCIALGLWGLLPTDMALVLWPLLVCLPLLWYLLCLPISWWCYKKLRSDILAGGDRRSGVIDDLEDLSASPPYVQV